MNSRITYFLFNVLLLPFYGPLFLYTLWRRFGQKKSAASFAGQWGKVPRAAVAALRADASTPVIWIHAVSVGEQMAARPIARALKEALPACRIALSCTTDTGFQTAQAALKSGEADAVFYFPLDLPFAVRRALSAIRPDVFLAVETELWPNFLHCARARGVLCLLVNGRVSDKLQSSAPRFAWLWRWMLTNLDALLMRSAFDAARMERLCEAVGARAAASKVLVPGDVKLDGVESGEQNDALRAKWREILKISEDEVLWVCGSTHPALGDGQTGEEEIALRIFARMRRQEVPLRLLLAPRHIERTGEVHAMCRKHSASVTLRSAIAEARGAGVIVLDTVGELSEIYASADVAFVGGSLVPRGGHNLLEPVLRGVPVLFGPHVANFREAAALVESAELGRRVADEDELRRALEYYVEDEAARAALPALARAALAPHRGAARRIAQEVAKRLKSKAGVDSSTANSSQGNYVIPATR